MPFLPRLKSGISWHVLMRDLQAIREACREEADTRTPLALATVVKVEGSAYRRPGARMLIYPDGRRIGSVSGGCLEADVVLRAQQVLATGEPAYVLYDMRVSNGDLIAELGCKGAVGILIERTSRPEVHCSLRFLASFLETRGQGAQATVFRVEGVAPVQVGDRLLQRAQGAVHGTLDAPDLMPMLLPDLSETMQSGQARTRTLLFPEGSAEALFEPVVSPISLRIFGAGQDAVPLAAQARGLGWQVTVIDHRPTMLAPERFPGVTLRLASRPEHLDALPAPDARTAAVLMSHNYVQDLSWLLHLLPSSLPYIGLLGPRKRAEQMRADLFREGIVPEAALWARLYSPAGLDLGSETPEEIAFAILGEIQAALHGRSSGSLRERKGPIHMPEPVFAVAPELAA
ncbi:MAG TPA: XdhC family protein [Chthonomonadaceae bacterium]|nr:XdhC family protein [Chthonomonadaceae bacterium]